MHLKDSDLMNALINIRYFHLQGMGLEIQNFEEEKLKKPLCNPINPNVFCFRLYMLQCVHEIREFAKSLVDPRDSTNSRELS